MRLYEDVDRGRQLIKSGRGAVYGVWIIDDLRHLANVPFLCIGYPPNLPIRDSIDLSISARGLAAHSQGTLKQNVSQ